MTDSAELFFPNEGVAAVYVSVPLGRFSAEWSSIGTAITAGARGFIGAPEILYLTGQADLAARARVRDFRGVVELDYPDPKSSHALIYNWVFSVPYAQPADAESADTVSPATVRAHGDGVTLANASADGPAPRNGTEGEKGAAARLRFVIHLRVRRGVYSYDPVTAERQTIAALRKILARTEGETSIEVGLGWSDLIINSAVPPSAFKTFLQTVADVNTLLVADGPDGERFPVFERTLTLTGYPWTRDASTKPEIVGVEPLMFLRSAPGALREVQRLLTDLFPGVEMRLIDGKSDIVAFIAAPSADFLITHEQLAEYRGRRAIQKMETHLLFRDERAAASPDRSAVSDDEVLPAQQEILSLPGLRVRDCACRSPRVPISFDFVPSELRQAIKNLQFLFNSAQLDSTNCCDTRAAVIACEESLRRLTRLLRTLHVETAEVDAQAMRLRGYVPAELDARVRDLNQSIVEQQRTIEQWVLTSERVLRQRTIGSFEEFLGQSDRAVVYRGGVQKILFLADHLMNDFYARLVRLDTPFPLFATMYDSVGTILSIIGTGLIRIPVRNLFSLAAIIPDLWHEVGVYRFFQGFPYSLFDLVRSSTRDMFRYRDLADQYGDIVVFHHGFSCDFDQFTVSVIQGWLDSQPHPYVPELAKQWNYAQVLSRLIATLEFLFVRVSPHLAARGREVLIPELYDHVTKVIKYYFGPTAPTPTPLTRARVLRYVLAPWFGKALETLTTEFRRDDVAAALRRCETRRADDERLANASLEAIFPLRAFTKDEDVNEAFRQLFWRIHARRDGSRKPFNAFGPMAALGRSAAIEYFRRNAP